MTKKLNRWLRGIIQNNADTSTNYMQNVELLSVEELCGELEYTTIHYFCHLMHTVEIIGYNHPDEKVRSVASEYYFGLVTALHLNPETKEQLDKRLEDRV